MAIWITLSATLQLKAPHVSTTIPAYPLLAVMALGLADALNGYLQPQADYFSTLGLPEALVHWGEYRSGLRLGSIAHDRHNPVILAA